MNTNSRQPNPDKSPTKDKAPVREPGRKEKMVLEKNKRPDKRSSTGQAGGSGNVSGKRKLANRSSPPTRPQKEGTEMGMKTEKRASKPRAA